jgi:hypothetical protein
MMEAAFATITGTFACLSNWACASSELPRSVNLIYRYKLLFEERLQTVPIVACVLPLGLCLVYTPLGIGDGGLCCIDTPFKFSLARPMRCFSIRQSRTGKYKSDDLRGLRDVGNACEHS